MRAEEGEGGREDVGAGGLIEGGRGGGRGRRGGGGGEGADVEVDVGEDL